MRAEGKKLQFVDTLEPVMVLVKFFKIIFFLTSQSYNMIFSSLPHKVTEEDSVSYCFSTHISNKAF